MSAKDEIHIIGAGPAGLSAAIYLAKRGRAVHVHEKRSAPGLRHHGFQGMENWSGKLQVPEALRSMEIEPDFLLRPVREVTYIGPERNQHLVKSPDPIFYLVRRGDEEDSLDRALVRQATACGAKITFNDPVEIPPPGSIVGIGPTYATAIAKGIVFRTDMPDAFLCIVDPMLAPKAYAYLLACGGSATLAVMLTEEFKTVSSCLQRAIDEFQQLRPFSMEDVEEFGGAGNIHFTEARMVEGRYIVGECVGAQDALWGFGITYALRSGRLAAQCLHEGTNYDRRFRKELLPAIRKLLVSRWLYERVPPSAYERYLTKFSAAPDARIMLRDTYGKASFLNILYPIAKRKYCRDIGDRRRHKEDCQCVWCRLEAGEFASGELFP